MKTVKSNYQDVYPESIDNPEEFWGKQGKLVSWYEPWKKVLDNSNEPFTKWFVGGKINACYNAIDRHIEAGKGSNTALIYDSPILGTSQKVTYKELHQTVSRLAGSLTQYGVEKGDRVIIFMPLVPQTAMAILACARIGAVHSVVFGGFAAGELSVRIQHCKPKVIILASCGLEPKKVVNYMEILDRALELSDYQPSKCIVYRRENVHTVNLDPVRDVDWIDAVKNGIEQPCIPVDANEPLYLLYTSGTTGDPKGIVRSIGGHLVVLTWSMKTFYNLTEKDIWWATSDFGWVLGHSYMLYAPLICGVTTIIYEGKPTTTPDPGQYYRVINDHKVTSLFTIPTALRVIKLADSTGEYGKKYDTSSLKNIWCGGEHCDLPTKMWAEKIFGVPLLNHWWQTETGSPVTGMCLGLNNPCTLIKTSVGLPVPGFKVEILRKDGSKADTNELGRIALKLPLPPGTATTMYNAPQRFIDTYYSTFPGYYDTMDIGHIDDDGLIYISGRSDDIINVSGHRLSTLSLENVILTHPHISNCCVVSVPDPVKSEVPFCLYVINQDSTLDERTISSEIISMVRNVIGPVACFNLCSSIRTLPMTISGKICRKSITDLANNNLKISATVVDPLIYDDIRKIFNKLGIFK